MADTNLIYPYTFEGGKKAVASEVNANFDAVRMFANGINATLSDIQTAIADLQKKPTREMFDIYFSITGETCRFQLIKIKANIFVVAFFV